MDKQIRFDKETFYKGRNGGGRMTGMYVNGAATPGFPYFSIYPLNSRGLTESCIMRIPVTAIPELIEILDEFYKRCHNVDVSSR